MIHYIGEERDGVEWIRRATEQEAINNLWSRGWKPNNVLQFNCGCCGVTKERDDAVRNCDAALARAEKAEKEIGILSGKLKKAEDELREIETTCREATDALRKRVGTPHKCPVCDGTGKDTERLAGIGGMFDCHACTGTGIVWSKP